MNGESFEKDLIVKIPKDTPTAKMKVEHEIRILNICKSSYHTCMPRYFVSLDNGGRK